MLLISLEELLISRDTFFSDSIRICNQFEKVHPSASPTNGISTLRHSVEIILFLPKISIEEIVQISQNAMEGSLTLSRDLKKFLGKLTSTIQSTLPVKLQIRFLQQIQIQALKKHDLQIFKLSNQLDNQYDNLQWKISFYSTFRPNHIFRCFEEGLECFLSRDYHRVFMVFSRESLAHKYSTTGSSEANNSFIYKIQKTKFNSSMASQHDGSLLIIKHGRHPEQAFNRNLRRNVCYLIDRKIHLTPE